MLPATKDEWSVIESLLPPTWREAAREQGAFRRARYTTAPASLLRLLLFHAVNDGGLRETVAQARAGGIAEMSHAGRRRRPRDSCALGWRRYPRPTDASLVRLIRSTQQGRSDVPATHSSDTYREPIHDK